METTNKELIDQLEEILEKNRDAVKGYENAAENAESQDLKTFFKDKASERAEFNDQLKTELSATYDEIDDEGSFSGSIHRTWMDIKNFFSGDNDEAMLEESIKGDKAAVEEYEEILKDTALPQNISILLRDQYVKIRSDLNKVRSLEDLHDR